MDEAQALLLAWYAEHARPLPWRGTRDPYRILVSEVMLQQTQAARVADRYLRFLAVFPDAAALAEADDERLHRAWKGLGYPSRAERLRAACRAVLAAGGWPTSVEGLQALPGVGPYTARALAAFAFAQPVAVLDTNAARVLCRRDGLDPRLPRAQLQERAERALYRADPIAWNNAVMELGALVCTAQAARCALCPWRLHCRSRGDDRRLAITRSPLRAASPRHEYGAPRAPRGAGRLVWALVHDGGRYLAWSAADGWVLPGIGVRRASDERPALAALLAALGGEVLAARFLHGWYEPAAGPPLRHSCYRVRLFAPPAGSALRWWRPAELLALPWPPALLPLAERLRRYHRREARLPPPAAALS
ncbi:MAG: A/G-specific adenine glycosylase [Planctomycetota bacterium]|nr:A/G-specific adenine glycosylase [Planctomycetota bacterium]MCX8039476.1 A/G-specific adenine glycosylase [Planctomycetota bacterium]MDW8373594.1 A/G-specific adenine glycosylase [Planctomycetota bacterium]